MAKKEKNTDDTKSTKKSDFDLGSISKKINLSGLMDNVKSIISPTSITIDAADGDEVGALLAHLNELVKEIAVEHEKQEQRLGQVSKTSAKIYALLNKEHPAPKKTTKKAAKSTDDAKAKAETAAEPAEHTIEEEVESDTITPQLQIQQKQMISK